MRAFSAAMALVAGFRFQHILKEKRTRRAARPAGAGRALNETACDTKCELFCSDGEEARLGDMPRWDDFDRQKRRERNRNLRQFAGPGAGGLSKR